LYTLQKKETHNGFFQNSIILCTSNQLFAAMPWYIELIFNTNVIEDTEQRLEEKNSHTR
jgi:hypothetical protein